MKRLTEFLSGSAAILFQVALAGWMFSLSVLNFTFDRMGLNYLLLSAVALLAYYINTALLRRGVPAALFAGMQLLFVAAGVFAFLHTVELEPYKTRTVVINCIIYCLSFVVAAYIAWTPASQNGVFARFDILTAMVVVLLAVDHVFTVPGIGGALGMCWLSLALILLAAISQRAGALRGRGDAVQGNPALGRILLCLVFGIIALLAVLVVIYAAGDVKSVSEFLLNVITVCTNGVKAALAYLYGLFERFILWLSQFVDNTPIEGAAVADSAAAAVTTEEVLPGGLPGWLYYIPGGIVAAALALLIFRLRKHKMGAVKSRTVAVTRARRESGLAAALRTFWQKITAEVHFRYHCLRHRRSAPGLLVWCEKKASGDLARACGESGEGFLLRLGRSLGGEAETTLSALAQLVERSFYSPQPAPVPAALYKAVKKTDFKPNHENDKTA